MPMLDVTDVLSDVDLADQFTVLRRQQVVNDFGENTVPKITTYTAYGVVDIAAGNDLRREPDQQHMIKTIRIITTFRLQGPSPGMQADIVRWHGDSFLVISLDDLTGFGAGFIQATATSIDYVDQAPPQ